MTKELTVEVLGGESINRAVAQAVAMAEEHKAMVVIPDFNGVRLEVQPSDTVASVLGRWSAEMDRKAAEYRASPAGQEQQRKADERAAREALRHRLPITEKDKAHEEWYEQASKQTLDSLPEFLRHLADDYGHDYGTICHALAAAAVGAATALDHSDTGGITGFQAGAVMWEFIRHWNHVKGPVRLVRYENMLYPQYGRDFMPKIDADTWKWLQDEARKNLASGKADPGVRAHWQSIADGVVPFGYRVVK